MKKTLITLIILHVLLITSIPNIKAQTTLEEYNYVTKGYKVQIESGLDMKNGYEFVDIDNYSNELRSAQLKGLYRIKEKSRVLACYLVDYKTKGTPEEFICIPNPNSDPEILKKYWEQLYNGSYSNYSYRLQLITFLLSRQLRW
jgi:hypothetical protein